MDPVYAELLGRVVDTYRHALANAPPAWEWLAKRGLSNAALLDRFRVGWSEGTLASMARGEVLDRLKTLGLLEADGGERFTGYVVVPVFDESDAVVQMAAYRPDGSVSWLFPEETPVFWNAACLKASRDVLVVPDPLAGILEIQGGREGVIAPAGPGLPLGQAARDALVAHGARVTTQGCDSIQPELEKLGVLETPMMSVLHDQVVEQDASGFTVEFPRRLRFVVQGIQQDSPRHLRASIKVFRRSVEGNGSP